jgi:amino acid transporter
LLQQVLLFQLDEAFPELLWGVGSLEDLANVFNVLLVRQDELPAVLQVQFVSCVRSSISSTSVSISCRGTPVLSISLFSGGGPDGIPLSPISPLNAFTGPAAGLGLFFAFWSWVGFESTAMYGEETRHPKRVIPPATLIVVIGIGLFYVFVSWMAISGNGLTQSVAIAREDAFGVFFDPTRQFVGMWAVDVFQWLLLSGSFACGMAFHNCASRYMYAIGREGFINRNLGRTHPEYGSPYIASFTQTAIAAIIVGLFWASGQDPYLGLYVLMALLGTFAILIVQTLCSFAVIGYFGWRRPEGRHWFGTLVAPLLGGIGMAIVVVLLFLNASVAAGEASGTLLFKLIPWIVIGVFLAGVALALYLRARSPDRYRRIGHIVYEDTTERSGSGTNADSSRDHATGAKAT